MELNPTKHPPILRPKANLLSLLIGSEESKDISSLQKKKTRIFILLGGGGNPLFIGKKTGDLPFCPFKNRRILFPIFLGFSTLSTLFCPILVFPSRIPDYKVHLWEKANSWERTEGQAGCGREKLQGYISKIAEPTENGHSRVVGIQAWLWARLQNSPKKRGFEGDHASVQRRMCLEVKRLRCQPFVS